MTTTAAVVDEDLGRGDHSRLTNPAELWDVEVIADSDSRWKWGATLAQRLAPNGRARVHATLLWGRSTPNEQQLSDVGITAASVRRASTAETVERLRDTKAQVVVLACVGGGVQAFLHALARAWAGREVRPVVVSGYVGVVYEKLVDGLLTRAGSDVVLANSAVDAERFRAVYRDLGIDEASVVQTALPFLDATPHDPTAAGRDRPYTVTFVAQPGVPATRSERTYALRQVAEHARRHPDRLVLVKLRGRPRERTTHVEPYHYATLGAARELPANVIFVYGPMAPVLDRTDLCVTVSSTAAIEAMHRGIPTAVLTDFGIRELLGNPHFLGSGALISWPELHAGHRPSTDPLWTARHGIAEIAPYTVAAARVAELVASGPDRPPLRPYLDTKRAGAYLPAVLARYGIDPSGTPQHPPAPPTLAGRAVRSAARRVYGVGVRVLEPRIKRLAQL
jgi:hypothetical protein